MKKEKRRKTAEKRAYARLGFYAHAAAYALAIAPLVGVNILVSPGVPWAAFPALGWGAGLGVHWLVVFLFVNPELKRRLVAREMRRLGAPRSKARTFDAAGRGAPRPGAWMN